MSGKNSLSKTSGSVPAAVGSPEARLVGIFGSGRNGSTLLMRLLDGSPGLWVYPAELNYLAAARVFGRTSDASGFSRWVQSQLEELGRSYLDHLAEPIQTGRDPVQRIGRERPSMREALPRFLDAVQWAYDVRVDGGPLLMFKSIEVTRLREYERLYPQMRFVHIVRDPASNYASLKRTDMIIKQKPFWFQGGDILRMHIEDRWIPHARFILAARDLAPGQHTVVRYEDLCREPARVISGICGWLGVQSSPDPVLQTVFGGRRMRGLPDNSSQKGVKTPDRVVADMASAFGYEDVLSLRELEFIRLRTGCLAQKLGYLAPARSTARRRAQLARQWLLPDRWELMNARPKLQLASALARRRWYIYSNLLFGDADA